MTTDRMRPNIVLITTDQQRFDTIQAHGASHMWTPHLNWLADNGVSYMRAYSDCPVCMPARLSIMNGLPAWRHGVTSNRYRSGALDADRTVPARLGRVGYETRLFGKHHHGPTTRHLMGFAAHDTIEHYERSPHRDVVHHHRHGLGGNEHVPGGAVVPFTETLDGWIVRRAVEFLETRDPSRPFFTWLSFLKPHPPWDPSPWVAEMYRESLPPSPLRGAWSERGSSAGAWHAVTDELSMTSRLAPWQIRAVRRAYAACVTEVDMQLGLLFGALGDLGLLESTWIVFTSDHGEMLGDHRMGGKCVPFEGSAHVPLIVRPPFSPRDYAEEARRGTVVDSPVTLTDVTRTILTLADADCSGLDPSGAILPTLCGPRDDGIERARRSRVTGSCMYMHYIVRDRWKYCRETLSGGELCFDLAEDPAERCDRSLDATEVRLLREEMDAHLDEVRLVAQRMDGPPDPGVLLPGTVPPRNVHPGFGSGGLLSPAAITRGGRR